MRRGQIMSSPFNQPLPLDVLVLVHRTRSGYLARWHLSCTHRSELQQSDRGKTLHHVSNQFHSPEVSSYLARAHGRLDSCCSFHPPSLCYSSTNKSVRFHLASLRSYNCRVSRKPCGC